MLSMANLSSSDSLQQPWSNSQSKNNSQPKSNSHSTQAGKKASGGAGGGNNSKRPTKRLPKKPRKSSSIESLDYDDEQDHMDACFKDSDYGKSRKPTQSAQSRFHGRPLELADVRPVLQLIF